MNSNYSFITRHYFSVNLWDIRKQTAPSSKVLLYEPNIKKLPFLYSNCYLKDRFSLSTDSTGNYALTGGYNNMFHIVDVNERLNSQIIIDDKNEKILNMNVIRKINSKGSCFYGEKDKEIKINYDNKITCHDFSPIDNHIILGVQNCIYTYTGNIIIRK